MNQDDHGLKIRTATDADFDSIWTIFHSIVAKGKTYAYPPEIDRAGAYHLWMEKPQETFVAVLDGKVVGTYYIKPNQAGPGSHVCNCGYMVASDARRQGVATSMCLHSQETARKLGFNAMQFNLVVATNTGAVRLWQQLGFEIVGTVPGAFQHPDHGFVEAHVMYKWLG